MASGHVQVLLVATDDAACACADDGTCNEDADTPNAAIRGMQTKNKVVFAMAVVKLELGSDTVQQGYFHARIRMSRLSCRL